MICKVISEIEKFNMIPAGHKVIVGLSGGADSCCLLDILFRLREKYGFVLEAAHINHGIRGAEAERDELFVADLCDRLGIKLHILHSDIPALSRESGEGLEECGRRVRYEFFAGLCDSGDLIATAHNADDRAETFLMNFTRGASLTGLCSIPPVRGNIIRPLIGCSKSEIISYCEDNGIRFVTDSTNSDTDYSRNRVRANVVGELKKINPAFVESSSRCIDSLCEIRDYFNSIVEKELDKCICNGGYDAGYIASLDPALSKRVIVRLCEVNSNVSPDSKAVESVLENVRQGKGSCMIPGGIKASVFHGVLYFDGCDNELPDSVILRDGENRFADKIIYVFNDENNSQICDNILFTYCIDCDKICGDITAGPRREGDTIHLFNRNCNKEIRRLLSEKGIPRERRNSVAVIRDESGVILLEGFGPCKRCAVTDGTERKKYIIFAKVN